MCANTCGGKGKLNMTTQQLMHTPTFSQCDTDQFIYPMYLPFHPCPPIYSSQTAWSTFTVGSSNDQATSKDHFHPSLPSHKMLIYSFNLLTIFLPLPLLVNSNCNLSIITHPIVTSHFQISNNFTSEFYLSPCYLTQTATSLLPFTPLSPLTISTYPQQFDFAK